MIEIILLLLTIILIFSISILIYKIIKNKEGFTNIDDTKDIKEARLKLNLTNNLINYQKGSKGFTGEKGRQGPPPLPTDDGRDGEIGDDGINGKNYGSLIFKNKELEEIDSLLNHNKKDPKHPDFIIEVPDANQGATGVVGTILFKNHKKEIIGSYYPPDGPNGAYAKSLTPIIIDVPRGIIGDNGDNGNDNTNPQGPRGEKGDTGNPGAAGERGDPGIVGDKGVIGGGNDEEIFNNVKVDNKVCFNEDNNVCIDINILKTLVNYDDYLEKLENRRLRIIKKLCYLDFYDEYNTQKHENRDELITEYIKQLKEIYDFNGVTFNYSEIVNKDAGTCPEFIEKAECTFDEDHLNDENQFLCGLDNCRCEKLTTNCGVGMFISRKAYIGKDDKDRDVYVSDNKCSECTLRREHIDTEKNEVYVGCDGVYDGIAASCEPDEFINIIGGSDGYECEKCPEGEYITENKTSTATCPEGHKCTGGKLIKCPHGQEYQNETGKTTCKECTPNFGKGKYIETECTSYEDAKYGECGPGYYCNDGITKRICSDAPCDAGKYKSNDCTTKSDRICSACTAKVTYCPGGDAGNINCTKCGTGQHMTDECTITNDRTCAKNLCFCVHGYGYKGQSCPTHESHKCEKCYGGYNLFKNKCIKNGITTYQNSNYSGSTKGYWQPTGYIDNTGGASYMAWWEDRISGFKKMPGASVSIHEHRNWEGKCTDLTNYDKIDFTDDKYDRSGPMTDWGWWNDKISSIRLPSKCEGADKWTPISK